MAVLLKKLLCERSELVLWQSGGRRCADAAGEFCCSAAERHRHALSGNLALFWLLTAAADHWLARWFPTMAAERPLYVVHTQFRTLKVHTSKQVYASPYKAALASIVRGRRCLLQGAGVVLVIVFAVPCPC